ncbi:MAG: radical SAM protein [Melioribacteraceae bacterium]|nr:radical SAM protein [Melioribacteraceae bacterium]
METGITNWLKDKRDLICAKLEKSILSNKSLKCRVVYGPVRSRRLGLVLGINNLKQKTCSYNCVYCPSGKTTLCSVCSNYCLSQYELYISVKTKLDELKREGIKIDYILFDGSGEPTLDSSLLQEIILLRDFGCKIAVVTNSSLLWNYNIQETLMSADYVSVKVDTAIEETWLRINRPHRRLSYDVILAGIREFSKKYKGILTTDTMLIEGYNDSDLEIEKLTDYIKTINAEKHYFQTMIYPTVQSNVESPNKEKMEKITAIIKEQVPNSVMLCCPETNEFFATNDFENELLGLLELHPVNREAVINYSTANGGNLVLQNLLDNNLIKEVYQNNRKYYALTDKQIVIHSN